MSQLITDGELQTVIEKLSHPMKVLIADPEVSRSVAESFAVAFPVAVEELSAVAVVLLHQYPTSTARRFLIRRRSGTEMFFVFVASCNFKRVLLFQYRSTSVI